MSFLDSCALERRDLLDWLPPSSFHRMQWRVDASTHC